MWKKLAKDEDFNSFLFSSTSSFEKVLVIFFTNWCSWCIKLQENLKNLFSPDQKDLLILEVNAEKFSQLTQDPEFNVQAIPAIFLFRQGKKIREHRGYLSIEELQKFCNS